MRFFTFQITGVEVLRPGERSAWPDEYLRQHRERWRIFTPAIDDYLTEYMAGRTYGGNVEGFGLILYIADFPSWPESTFAGSDLPPSFKRSSRDIRSSAKLPWPEIGEMTLTKQYKAYVDATLSAVDKIRPASRMPKGFSAEKFKDDLVGALKLAKPSQFTRASYQKRTRR